MQLVAKLIGRYVFVFQKLCPKTMGVDQRLTTLELLQRCCIYHIWRIVESTRSVSHWGLVIYIKKYLKEKEEL
jgi:hypothetical protein